jgi:membrane fusion protein (multidrug efflux system)
MPQIYQADVLKAKAEVAQAEIELQNCKHFG